MPTALIVEDEPEANKLLGMLLRLRGYQTESAFTGEEALHLVAKAQPDIIFLDLMLPDLNGYEICKILKSSKGTSLIPLVIITARVADENRIESFCLGADDYIAKPYTPDQIFQAVEQAVHWFDQSRSGQIQASVSFDHGDDGEILRRLGQFRSLVFARTALSLEAVAQHRPGHQGNLVCGRRVVARLPGRSHHDPDVHAHGRTAGPGIPRRRGLAGKGSDPRRRPGQ